MVEAWCGGASLMAAPWTRTDCSQHETRLAGNQKEQICARRRQTMRHLPDTFSICWYRQFFCFVFLQLQVWRSFSLQWSPSCVLYCHVERFCTKLLKALKCKERVELRCPGHKATNGRKTTNGTKNRFVFKHGTACYCERNNRKRAITEQNCFAVSRRDCKKHFI